MDACNNCKRTLGCSCQKRIASNGNQCCAACVAEYEKKLLEIKRQQEQAKQNP